MRKQAEKKKQVILDIPRMKFGISSVNLRLKESTRFYDYSGRSIATLKTENQDFKLQRRSAKAGIFVGGFCLQDSA